MQIRKKQNRHRTRCRSGLIHRLYDHHIRTARIEVVCPKCAHLALAQDQMTSTGLCSDTSSAWQSTPFMLHCNHCGYHANQLSYVELPPPYHQIYLHGNLLWAWNREHLEMIYLYLQGNNISSHPYARLASYIHGSWKKKSARFVREIERHLINLV